MQEMLLFVQQYGYLGIVFLLALGIIGLPIPDEVLMAAIGYLISKGYFSFSLAYLSSVIGSIMGISISYLLGLKLGLPFLLRFGPKLSLTKAKIERAQSYFRKYGVIMLLLGYFIPGLRHLVGYFAGMAKIPLRKFFLYSLIGSSVWSITCILIGRELGHKWHLVEPYLKSHALYSIIGIVAASLVFIIYKARKRASRKKVV